MPLKRARTLIIALLCLAAFLQPLSAYTDFYDIKGDFLFNGDPLYEFSSYSSPTGGYNGNYWTDSANQDRFMRDFGSQLTLYEWINNREYELKLGRFETWFTPLTLHITRFRWGYAGSYYNSWYYPWGKWWDQRNARIRATKGSDEWQALVTKTAYFSTTGDNSGQEWTSAVNKDRYFVALRRRVEISGMKMGFSFVNQHYTNFKTDDPSSPNFYSAEGPLVGQIDDNIPSTVYIKFTDDSPVNEAGNADYNGSAVYEIRTFVNGVENADLSVSGTALGANVSKSGTFTQASDKFEASGPNDLLTFAFNLTAINAILNKDVKSLRFLITVANDYKIQASRDNATWWMVTRSPGNVKDYSNKTVIAFTYGEETGTTLLGYDIEGVIPGVNVPFKAELAGIRKFFKYPTANGIRSDQTAMAWYVNASREFYPFILSTEIYDFDYNYDASFAVEDNDAKDPNQPDIINPYVPFYREWQGTQLTDTDFVMFKVDSYFREGLDMNNNKALDTDENDIKPDYPYRENQKGYVLSTAVKPIPGLKCEGVYLNSTEKASDLRNQTIFGKVKYSLQFAKVGVDLRHEYKSVRDNIPDSLVYDPTNPNIDTTQYDQGKENWVDPLVYRDNSINNTYITLSYRLFQNLQFVNRYFYGNDIRFYSDEIHDSQDGVFRVNYNNWFPFKNVDALRTWQVVPMYKLERWNETSAKGDDKEPVGDWRKDAFALVFTNKITDKTSVFLGQQIVVYDDMLADNDSVRNVFATEMVHKDQYWNRPLVVTAGLKFVNQDAILAINKVKYEYMYIKAYFQW